MAYKILLADDEAEIRELLKLYLEKEGYQIIEAGNGIDALKILDSKEISLAVLDIMMPGLDGFRLLKKLREKSNIPVMIISAKIGDSDKILGLDLGADDYITKPFNPLEVTARVNSNIRRFYSLGAGTDKQARPKLKCRDLYMDTESCQLYVGDEAVELTSVEYRIMLLFMENPGKVFTKQQIFERGWEEEFIVADNNIMVCISKLRAKLSEDKDKYIKTIRGLGYRLEK